jgi:hypothetical protein
LGEAAAIVRTEGGMFAPGHSANPGGRSKHGIEVARLARESSPAIMQRLINLAMGYELLDDGAKKPVKPSVSKQQVDVRTQTAAFVAMLPAPIADAAAWASAAAQLATPPAPKCVNGPEMGPVTDPPIPASISEQPRQARLQPAGKVIDHDAT